jgi:hypothetical protein
MQLKCKKYVLLLRLLYACTVYLFLISSPLSLCCFPSHLVLLLLFRSTHEQMCDHQHQTFALVLKYNDQKDVDAKSIVHLSKDKLNNCSMHILPWYQQNFEPLGATLAARSSDKHSWAHVYGSLKVEPYTWQHESALKSGSTEKLLSRDQMQSRVRLFDALRANGHLRHVQAQVLDGPSPSSHTLVSPFSTSSYFACVRVCSVLYSLLLSIFIVFMLVADSLSV